MITLHLHLIPQYKYELFHIYLTKANLFRFGCSEVNSTWLITYELANQRARKALFTCVVYTNLLYRHECFTGKYTTCKIHKNCIRDPSGLFSIISHVSLSMISVMSSLSLKLHLISLVYHRNIFGSSSEVFGNLRTSWKFAEIFGKCSGRFVWPSEQIWKIFGNLRKVVGNLRKIIKNAVISMSI